MFFFMAFTNLVSVLMFTARYEFKTIKTVIHTASSSYQNRLLIININASI